MNLVSQRTIDDAHRALMTLCRRGDTLTDLQALALDSMIKSTAYASGVNPPTSGPVASNILDLEPTPLPAVMPGPDLGDDPDGDIDGYDGAVTVTRVTPPGPYERILLANLDPAPDRRELGA